MKVKDKITLDEIIGNHFDKDYPDDENMTDEDSQFVGSMYDVYKKGFTSALNIKSDEMAHLKEIDFRNELKKHIINAINHCNDLREKGLSPVNVHEYVARNGFN